MKLLAFAALAALTISSCNMSNNKEPKIDVYGWIGEGKETTEESLMKDFGRFAEHGMNGICYNAGQSVEKHTRAAKAAHANGLEYHAWIPAMLQGGLDSTLYTVNRDGERADLKPAYVPYYKSLCPSHKGTYDFLTNMYAKIADIPEVDYIHLDYIRFVDVILAKGLWNKYGLVMDEEYPKADYCYCDKCVGDFKEKTGIDIKAVDDPSKVEEWGQFRCDLITDLVNHISAMVHEKGKKISAAVFPGPDSHAKWMVRQEWDKWNLDAVFPMNYNDFYLEGPEWVGEVTKEAVESVNGKMPVYSGLFICRDWKNKASIKDPEGHGLIPSEIGEAIKGSIDAGAVGIALFTPNSMTDLHWEELKKAIDQL